MTTLPLNSPGTFLPTHQYTIYPGPNTSYSTKTVATVDPSTPMHVHVSIKIRRVQELPQSRSCLCRSVRTFLRVFTFVITWMLVLFTLLFAAVAFVDVAFGVFLLAMWTPEFAPTSVEAEFVILGTYLRASLLGACIASAFTSLVVAFGYTIWDMCKNSVFTFDAMVDRVNATVREQLLPKTKPQTNGQLWVLRLCTLVLPGIGVFLGMAVVWWFEGSDNGAAVDPMHALEVLCIGQVTHISALVITGILRRGRGRNTEGSERVLHLGLV